MQFPTYTTILTLALSASTLAFPAPANITDSDLDKRSNAVTRIGSFQDPTCKGKPVENKWKGKETWQCFKFTPTTDNVGIDWATYTRALGIDFFTDDKCEKWATSTVYAPSGPAYDNGKGKADKCLSYKANGGNWKSARFIYPSGQAFVDYDKFLKNQKKVEIRPRPHKYPNQRMHILSCHFILTLLSTIPSTFSASPPAPLQTVTIHSLPSTPSLSSPAKPLATLTFSPQHPHLSKISSFTPPRLNPANKEDIIQVGICYDGTKDCRTTATLAKSFHPPYRGRFRIVVTRQGEVLSVSWRSWLPNSSSPIVKEDERRYQEGGRGDFDIVVQSQAPGVWVDKPATKGRAKAAGGKAEEGKGKEGDEEEEVDERSFLQR
ncbi:MAG: hypothetical protein Q9169_004339 [Polycauliona sp. 2 TL-2023]